MNEGRATLRQILRGLIGLLLRPFPLDGLLWANQRLGAFFSRLILIRDWNVVLSGRPQFFKHRIDLSTWVDERARWGFTARGVHARQNMFPGAVILDLCCGDGFYSYFFFSDVALIIDGVDRDFQALHYARRFHSCENINYRQLDVVREPLPRSDYDLIVWNAAICYFSREELQIVLGKIASAGKATMCLCGMLPRANGWLDHKTEFADTASVEALFVPYFLEVSVIEAEESGASNFYGSSGLSVGKNDVCLTLQSLIS